MLRRKTYSWLKAQRDLLVNAKAFSIDEDDRAALGKAIQGLENEMYRRGLVSVFGAATILVILSIISGCYSIHGIGKDLSTWSRPFVENADR